MASHRVQQWVTFARQWWIYDARWQCPFKSAPVLIKYLQGRHKPIYHPQSNCGDHVVVINTKEIALADELWRTKMYYHHTGYPGGFSETRAYQLHDKDPTKVFYKAVYHGMEGNLSRRMNIVRLHLYPDEDVPLDVLKNVNGQIRQVMPVPKRIDEYTPEDQDKFPRLFEWPEDYVPTGGQKKDFKIS